MKTKTPNMNIKAIVSKTRGALNDMDRYNIEGILQANSIGWVVASPLFRTNSTDLSSVVKAENGSNVYLESMPAEDASRFYDLQGFYRDLSKYGYSLIKSKITQGNGAR